MERIELLALRLLVASALIGSALVGSAQTAPDTYWVAFADKVNTPYSLNDPSAFLSERSLARRAAQGIALDDLDLPVDPAYIQAVLDAGEVQLINRSKWMNGVTVCTTDQSALALIQGLSFVQGMRPTGNSTAPESTQSKFTTPTLVRDREDEAFYGSSYRQLEMLNGQALHQIDAKGAGMLIGVLDSGFLGVDSALAFAHVRDRGGIVHTRDLVDHDGDVYDDHNHGRNVLSCMAASLEGQILGTAPDADYVLLRTENAGTEYPVEEDHWIAGAELADSLGCDVLNTSLGYTVFDDSTMDHTYADMDGQTLRISIAANIALRKGMLPVNSAGNSGSSDWYYIGAPADAIGILTVGAVNDSARYVSFSSHGPSADGRVKPDVCAMGAGSVVLRSEVDSVAAANGTSFASPILAGLVACLWQLHPDRTAEEIAQAVRRSASTFETPSDSLGYGIPDFGMAHELLVLSSVGSSSGEKSFLAYPVPFQDRLVVAVPEDMSGQVRVSVVDPSGRTVRESTHAASARIALSGLQGLDDGLYILILRSGTRTLSRAIVKAP